MKDKKCSITTDKQLLKMAKIFAKLLRLEDWEIALKFVNIDEMRADFSRHSRDSRIRVGSCGVDQSHKFARIKLLHPKHYPVNGWEYPSQEEMLHVLVHELLHIHFDMLMVKESLQVFEEQAINFTADAIVNLYLKKA